MCADLEQKQIKVRGRMSVNTVVLPNIQLECVSLYTSWPRQQHVCWEQCAGNMDRLNTRQFLH